MKGRSPDRLRLFCFQKRRIHNVSGSFEGEDMGHEEALLLSILPFLSTEGEIEAGKAAAVVFDRMQAHAYSIPVCAQ